MSNCESPIASGKSQFLVVPPSLPVVVDGQASENSGENSGAAYEINLRQESEQDGPAVEQDRNTDGNTDGNKDGNKDGNEDGNEDESEDPFGDVASLSDNEDSDIDETDQSRLQVR
jgi:hypothetical protein